MRTTIAAAVALALLAGCSKPKGEDASRSPAPAGASPPPSASATSVTTAEPERAPYEVPLEVPIATLEADYKANELRADSLYKGKLVRVAGTVQAVSKGITGGAFVTLTTGGQLEIPAVQCHLADEADPLALALNAGSKAVVQGRVHQLLGHVQIRECVVNPMMRLCQRMKQATGAQECRAHDTGDADAIIFDGDKSGENGTFASLECIAASPGWKPGVTPESAYTFLTTSLADKPPKKGEQAFVVGSTRTFCYAWGTSSGKTAPGWKEKAEAFFAKL